MHRCLLFATMFLMLSIAASPVAEAGIEGEWEATVVISQSEVSEVVLNFDELAPIPFGQLFVVSTSTTGDPPPFNYGFGLVFFSTMIWTDATYYVVEGTASLDSPTQSLEGIINQFDGYKYGFTAVRPE